MKTMYMINDAMLTLILRFAGHRKEITFSNQEFIQNQLKDILGYIEKYPPEEREMRAMEWIAIRARQYRKAWEKEGLTKELISHRCPDCPLSDPGAIEHCEIHDQWLDLLHQYMASEIKSRKYVESALELLAQNKDHLMIKRGMLKVRAVG